jgi:hypothetical protein
MKCPFCPKEFPEEKGFMRFIKKREYYHNEELNKHIRLHHIKKTK